MLTLRHHNERGHANHGWLDSHFSFSFSGYYDPDHMGFKHLRVINDDWIQPDNGFGLHPHQDMEIFTYVLDGELAHTDSEGHTSTIKPGRVQLMRAGSGIYHSEMNPSKDTAAHLLQNWILPARNGLEPGYWEFDFDDSSVRNTALLMVGPDGSGAPLTIEQDARIYASRLDAGQSLELPLDNSSHAWLQVATGDLTLSELTLTSGDGLAITDESALTLAAETESEVLFFTMT